MSIFYTARRSLIAFASAAVLSLQMALPATAQETLTLAFIPQENPDKLLGDIKEISAYLSQRIGVPVNGFVTIDHAAAVEALRNGDADISFMGALPFVLAEAEIGAVPLLSEIYRGAPTYKGRIFVRRDSGITSLEDLRGKDIAFADPISESGYLFPLDLFIEAGLVADPAKADDFFGRTYFAGGYQQAMQAMATGLVDAATASQYADLLLTPDQQSQVIWIGETAPLPSHLVIARTGLDSDLQDRFVAAMMSLNEPENAAYLRYIYGPDGYAIADKDVFEPIRAAAR
ncbi:MAG TPA: phosphate/phosphite/phosphonate ABC transporter substrate-binding protein, partial [Roseibacterium sp.]|nr:phosphate/phosphite/phosphonate ABC transporter substrate-binding protein [Roseibacterium sp.]